MSDSLKRSLETDGTKEEDWEVVSGAKSLSLESKATSENKDNEGVVENKQEKENTIKGLGEEENVLLYKDIKSEEVAEDEPEDWYQTIPATPLNTPEYKPAPPTYPTSNRGSDTFLEELAPIAEETSEDQNPNVSTPGEQTAPPQEMQDDSQNTVTDFLKQSFTVIRYTLTRLAIFIVGFSLLKWSFCKVSEQIKKIKQSRSQIKKNAE